jgi:DNA polymerase I-like protein with 3'-5' exonuclease and polymerase domains
MITPFKLTKPAMKTKHDVLAYEGLSGGVYHLIDNMRLWKDFFAELIEQTLVACDTETTGLDYKTSEIVGMSFSWSPEHSYYIPIRHETNDKQLCMEDILDDLKTFFSDEDITTVWHNFKYDAHMYLNEGIEVKGVIHDTLLMACLIDENISHKLKDLSQTIVHGDAQKWEHLIDEWRISFARTNKKDKREGLPIKKDEVHYGYIPINMMVPYAASDTHYTLKLFEEFWPEICEADDQVELYITESNLMHCLLSIEEAGVFIDKPYMETLGPILEEEYIGLEQEIKDVLGDINTNSPKQMVQAFLDHGIKLTKKNKTKTNYCLDAGVMENLSRKYEICKKILRYRKLVKKKNTFVDSIIEKADIENLLHCNYNQMVRTGRLCIAKGSLVQMPCDRIKYPNGVPIEKVKTGDMVYSYDTEGNLLLKKVKFAGKTGYKKVVKISWQGSGHKHKGELRLTPEHTIMKTNGEWVKAENLKKNDRIMSLSSGIKKNYGYNYLYARYGKELREHRFIYKQLMNHNLDVHHKDGNKLNNNIDNLIGMTKSQHSKFHSNQIPKEVLKDRGKYLLTPEALKNKRKSIKKGPENPGWKTFSPDVLFELAFECKGQIRKIMEKTGSDYEVLMRKYKRANIDLKSIRYMFGSKGIYLSPGIIIEADKLPQPYSYQLLGIHHNKFRELCDFYEVPRNHEILSVIPDGMSEVYDLEIEDTKSFIANELCVHNSCSGPNLMNIDGTDTLIRSSFVVPKEVKCVGNAGLNPCGYHGKHTIIPAHCPDCGGQILDEDNYTLIYMDYCLTGDAEVITIEGVKKLKDLVKNPVPVLSCSNKGELAFKDVTRSGYVGDMEVVKITFTDGKTIECTEDHKWMNKKGELVETEKLVAGDKLMHVKESHAGLRKYPTWYVNSNRNYKYKHRLVTEKALGKTPEGHEVDHIDGNPNNNLPHNLRFLPIKENRGQGGRRWWESASLSEREQRTDSLVKGILENRRNYEGTNNPNYGKYNRNHSKCLNCGEDVIAPVSRDKKYCNKKCRGEYRIKQNHIPCKYCGKIFHSKRKRDCYCSKACKKFDRSLNYQIKSIEKVGIKPVYQITVDDYHTYVLENGLVSGNSQMEVRFTGILSKDEILHNIYTKTFEDNHTRTLCEVFDRDYAEVSTILDDKDNPNFKKTKALRGIAKMINFLVIYGGTAGTLAERISTPEKKYTKKQCQVFMDAYFEKYWGVRTWIAEEKMYIRKHHQGQNVFGRWRRFPELAHLLKRQVRANNWKIEKIERQWVNTLVQGGCADLFKKSMTNVYNYLKEKETKSKIIKPIHDELAFYFHVDELELLPDVKAIMEDYDFSIPMLVDISFSTTNWADKQELKL